MSGPAVVGLELGGVDVQRPDLDVFLQLSEGLDELPAVRGQDDVVPFRTGRVPRPRYGDHRRLVLDGWIAGAAGSDAAASYRAYVDAIKAVLDPTRDADIVLRATLEDGSVRWIYCRPRTVIPGERMGDAARLVSVELEALDPFWYGSNGTLTMDSGLFMDAGLLMDSDAWVTVNPTSDPYNFEFFTLGNTDITNVRVEIDGPSTGLVRVGHLNFGEFISFQHPALTAEQTLVVDSDARTVLLNGVTARAAMALGAGNQHGEYFRLRAGPQTIQIIGTPAEVRLYFPATYL